MEGLHHTTHKEIARLINRVMLKILKKMKHEYRGKWSDHLANVLWACRNFVKTAIGFSPFSLVYGQKPSAPRTQIMKEGWQIWRG